MLNLESTLEQLPLWMCHLTCCSLLGWVLYPQSSINWHSMQPKLKTSTTRPGRRLFGWPLNFNLCSALLLWGTCLPTFQLKQVTLLPLLCRFKTPWLLDIRVRQTGHIHEILLMANPVLTQAREGAASVRNMATIVQHAISRERRVKLFLQIPLRMTTQKLLVCTVPLRLLTLSSSTTTSFPHLLRIDAHYSHVDHNSDLAFDLNIGFSWDLCDRDLH